MDWLLLPMGIIWGISLVLITVLFEKKSKELLFQIKQLKKDNEYLNYQLKRKKRNG